jgi:hypothetical protein
MQPTASNRRGPPPLRWRTGTPAAKSPPFVQEGGNNDSWLVRAGLMLSSATSRPIGCIVEKSGGAVLHCIKFT